MCVLSVVVVCELLCSVQCVIRVSVEFERETFVLFERRHISSVLMHSCRWVEAMCGYGC